MKINISRPYLYLLGLSLLLLIVVIVFSFAVLIPKGKEYRVKRVALEKISNDLHKYENLHNETQKKLADLRSKNRRIITAFDATFNPDRFEKENKKHFISLHIAKVNIGKVEDGFAVYEVNTTSKISSPKVFYDFLERVNKSDWMIKVNFPIIFQREDNLIQSSFTMKVYCNNRDTKRTTSASEAK